MADQERVYEMLWDCRFCGTARLLGKTHRFCPNCGGAQDPAWRYFPSDDEKVAVQDHTFVGVDKICPACGSLSAASAQFCGACGSPLDRAQAARTVGERRKAAGEAFETEDLAARQEREMRATASLVPTQSATRARGTPRWLIVVGMILALVIIGGVLAAFWTKETTAVVADYRWVREIRIEALQARNDSSECDSMPGDAYSVERRREQVDTRRIPDGQECHTVQTDRGDGTFSERQVCETKYREEPVYGDVCYYTVNRWDYKRTARAEGDRSDGPYWPDTNLRTGRCLGCEREAGRDESYTLIFRRSDTGDTFECDVPADEWQATAPEQTFTVKVGAVLGDERCDTLAAR
ncbi:MAG: zinc ribbon domain-containing protein [Chloroflexi bacterium]|nr:zinc ribbon domain-containing protein [Chloroflexota bacterium]